MVVTHKRVTDKVKPWVVKVLKDIAPDEDVLWEIGVNTFPDPANEDSLYPFLVIYLEIKTDNPELCVYTSFALAIYNINSDRVRKAITESIELLRKKRKVVNENQEIDDTLL